LPDSLVRSQGKADNFLAFLCRVEQGNWLQCLLFVILRICKRKSARVQNVYRNVLILALSLERHVYRKGMPFQHKIFKGTAFRFHYTHKVVILRVIYETFMHRKSKCRGNTSPQKVEVVFRPRVAPLITGLVPCTTDSMTYSLYGLFRGRLQHHSEQL